MRGREEIGRPMSAIHIRHPHSKSLAEAKQAAEKVARQLKRDFELDYAWNANVLRFKRPGVDGELHVSVKEIRLDARLGFLLSFLAPRIEAEAKATLVRVLGAPAKHAARVQAATKKKTTRD
jgi:putative polyhydroxyalkanoate system protein